jgi:putative ABC transport system permease protein
MRQFFLEGFIITLVSGALGMAIALGLCALVNLAPLPPRFSGMILSPVAAVMTVLSLVLIGVLTSVYPARRAAELRPVDALRYEM